MRAKAGELVFGSCVAACLAAAQPSVRPIGWADVVPLHSRLEARGLAAAAFPSYVERLRQANARRVREGDLDHLIFYLLQSTRITTRPPIEPALSAKALVESLDAGERERFLREGQADLVLVPPPVRARVTALLRALDSGTRDPRLTYFQELVTASFPERREREAGLSREYLRVMKFVYEKEFVAQRAPRAAEAVASLYRTRGLSTDTATEAGYLVSLGLSVVRSLEPARRIRRVLIVGPGLDLAPRTAMQEAGPPESYQPWAVIDALVSLGLSTVDDLQVMAADINPRVVQHLRRSRLAPPRLTLASEIRDSDTVTISPEYREYFARLGEGIGTAVPSRGGDRDARELFKTVRVRPSSAQALTAEQLDIVTERFADRTFDLAIATNILPYFDDTELALALSNVAAMLVPGGILVHNEARPIFSDLAVEVGLPLAHGRTATIATVRGGPPLVDRVLVHLKKSSGAIY